ncbi:transglutaminase-like domain-containing protein [Vibrio vulnificus]|uniref:transglutaminase-like domain-containing protein n=1 Tax=Vibrio vulnificus TaxID=672 RepID=UPI000CD311F4|nr:transglutaminase-like domain-containing protein [Vibrio vulnificus]EGQ7833870.1 sugar-binding protein [Vibrio vulnificus]EGQ7930479.1 sugar-binding protein [Vibrio vulnificus]EGQ9280654.1 sugar-binding protein [Vibrio vulnificus]EGQ9970066.1 sugar-binding protein [Vibrio vulnificus]EIJ0941921.1 hypothetical protein [Vibrio vulnificus]
MTNRQKRYNEMFNAGLDFLRETVLAKMTTFIVLFTFNFVFYFSPTALAVKADFNQQDQQEAAITALLESTPEAKLSHRLSKLKEAIVYEVAEEVKADKAPQGFLARTWSSLTSSGPISTDSILELERLASEVEMAYAEAIEKLKTEIADSTQQTSKLSSTALALLEERQNQALQQVESQYAHLTTLLQNLTEADSEDVQIQAYEDLTDFLVNSQFKATHTPATPENLPWRTPSADVREPIEDVKELTSLLSDTEAQLVDEPMQMAARSLSRSEPVRPELAESIEVVLTPEIRALAAELNHSSIEIYTWVHNNIKFIPSYGSIQGAQQTLELKQGNAMDTASLLIALLRASEIPARYAYGTVIIPAEKVMNWVGGAENPEAAQTILGMGGIPTTAIVQGGEIVSFKLEHVWTEAWVDFMPSRGVVERSGDSWIPMDASFKQYSYMQGMDVESNVSMDMNEFYSDISNNAIYNEAEGWIQGVPLSKLEGNLNDLQNAINQYVIEDNTGATVFEVLGSQTIAAVIPRPLSAGLPFDAVIVSNRFAHVPESMKHKFRYKLQLQGADYLGSSIINIEKETAALANKSLSLSFKPASPQDEEIILSYLPNLEPDGTINPHRLPKDLPGYLINMEAVFSIDGIALQSTVVGSMGSELIEEIGVWSPAVGWQTSMNRPIVGSYRAIGLNLQGISSKQSMSLIEKLNSTKSILDSADSTEMSSLSSQELVGDILHSVIMNYFLSNDIQDSLLAKSAGVINYRLPSYGVFSTNLQTQYWFGLPRNVEFSGLSMDVDHLAQMRVAQNNDATIARFFSEIVGPRASALEHLIPELLFSGEQSQVSGISAVKALNIAAQQGQKIWSISSDNLENALGSINLSVEAENDIRNSVLSGHVVTAHEAQIIHNGWVGEGYVITDPKDGSGAYIISGGGNGSYVAGAIQGSALGILLALASFLTSPAVLAGATVGAVAFFWVMIFSLVVLNFYLLYRNSQILSDSDSACYLGGFFTWFGISGLFSLPGWLGRALAALGLGVGYYIPTTNGQQCMN